MWSSRAVRWCLVGLGSTGAFASACGGAAATTPPTAKAPRAAHSAAPTEAERLALEARRLWDRREDAGSAERALEAFRRAAALSPEDSDAWVDLAGALYHLARTAQLAGEHEAALKHHASGQAAVAPALPGLDETGLDALHATPRHQAAALYWYTLHRSAIARLGGFGAEVVARAFSLRALRVVRELDASIDHAGPDRELGRLIARSTSPLSRDLGAAQAHLQRAVSLAPEYLANRLALAAEHAVRAQDRASFERELRNVLEADPQAGQSAADNRMAQREAEALLASAGELFE